MSYFEAPPQGQSQRIAEALWRTDAPHQSLILPDGCTDLLFLPARGEILVVGAMTRAVRASAPAEVLGVRLRPWAARALLGVDASRLRDSRVKRARRPEEIADALEALSAQRVVTQALDPRVRCVAERLQESPDRSVAALSREVGLSARQLQRLFVSHAGMPPKMFARICRLQRARWLSHSMPNLAALAAEAGYADQAHLCREVRGLVGLPAARLFAVKMSDSFKPGGAPSR